ncbi:MAG: hypothetical protein ACJ8AD_15930 [Gemmatimonadaceae bacterium]
MRSSHATPPTSPIDAPSPLIDEALVRRAHELLEDVVNRHPVAVMMDKGLRGHVFGPPMTTLCDEARARQLPIERVIVAVKHAWSRLPVRRTQLGDVSTDVLSSVISVCIEQYFADSERRRQS